MGHPHPTAPCPHAPATTDTFTPRRARLRSLLTLTGVLAGATLLTGCADDIRATEAEAAETAAVTEQASSSPRLDNFQTAVLSCEKASGEGCQQDAPPSGWESYVDVHKVAMCAKDTVIASFWDNDAQEEMHTFINREIGEDFPDHVFLDGDEWSVFTAADTAEDIQSELGGEIFSVEAPELPGHEDIVKALRQVTGADCDISTEIDDPAAIGGASCDDLSGMAAYDNREALQAELDKDIATMQALFGDSDEPIYELVGDTWMINADQEILEKIQDKVGGELVRMN